MTSSNPLEPWKADPSAIVPHEEVRQRLINLLIESNSKEWDQQTPKLCRDYYLKRTAGLKAYSTYEADHYLNALNLHDQRQGQKSKVPKEWRWDQFAECILLIDLNKNGVDAVWDTFHDGLFKFKRKRKDTTFFRKLGSKLEDGRAIRYPNNKMRLYATGYDRCFIPWEYCPDSAIEQIFFKAVRVEKVRKIWGDTKMPNTASIEKWRKRLGLKTTRPHAVKLDSSSRDYTLHPENCLKLGIPKRVLAEENLKILYDMPADSEPNNFS